MTKKDMITLLNADLERERSHLGFYLHAASIIRGPHREELGEFFLKQAASEMQHIKQFQDLILELGGNVTANWGASMVGSDDPEGLLRFALKMEDEVVNHYVERLEQAAVLGGVDGTYVSLFMEEQIMDSKTDAAHIRRMLP